MSLRTIDAAGVMPAGSETVARRPDPRQGARLGTVYTLRTRLTWTVAAIVLAVCLAGFWNARAVDGFGRDVVAANTIGDTKELASSFDEHGMGFGVIFAAVVGLAATFTACNCVVFAMLPGLACSTDPSASRTSALGALYRFAAGVLVVGAAYGAFIGSLGPERITAFNELRRPQAQLVFTLLGGVMLAWGAIEFGYLDRLVRRLSPETRAFFARPSTKASLMGLMVGLFAVGRPFPVFRDFLTYAATANSPLYGALIMAIQGLGQIALMVGLFLAMIVLFRDGLTRWVTERPLGPSVVTAVALVAGGTYFVYYWGLALAFDLGRWGFKLGLYS
jgi:cytochrome c biogenesis protein CcdA